MVRTGQVGVYITPQGGFSGYRPSGGVGPFPAFAAGRSAALQYQAMLRQQKALEAEKRKRSLAVQRKPPEKIDIEPLEKPVPIPTTVREAATGGETRRDIREQELRQAYFTQQRQETAEPEEFERIGEQERLRSMRRLTQTPATQATAAAYKNIIMSLKPTTRGFEKLKPPPAKFSKLRQLSREEILEAQRSGIEFAGGAAEGVIGLAATPESVSLAARYPKETATGLVTQATKEPARFVGAIAGSTAVGVAVPKVITPVRYFATRKLPTKFKTLKTIETTEAGFVSRPAPKMPTYVEITKVETPTSKFLYMPPKEVAARASGKLKPETTARVQATQTGKLKAMGGKAVTEKFTFADQRGKFTRVKRPETQRTFDVLRDPTGKFVQFGKPSKRFRGPQLKEQKAISGDITGKAVVTRKEVQARGIRRTEIVRKDIFDFSRKPKPREVITKTKPKPRPIRPFRKPVQERPVSRGAAARAKQYGEPLKLPSSAGKVKAPKTIQLSSEVRGGLSRGRTQPIFVDTYEYATRPGQIGALGVGSASAAIQYQRLFKQQLLKPEVARTPKLKQELKPDRTLVVDLEEKPKVTTYTAYRFGQRQEERLKKVPDVTTTLRRPKTPVPVDVITPKQPRVIFDEELWGRKKKKKRPIVFRFGERKYRLATPRQVVKQLV